MDKQSADDSNSEKVITTEVSSNSITKRVRGLFGKNLRGLGPIVLLVILLFVAFWFVSGSKTVFTVNGKKYSQRQVKHLAAYETEQRAITYKAAAKDVYEAVKLQAAGQAAHLSPSKQELASAQQIADKKVAAKYKDWFDILAYNASVKEMVQASKQSGNVFDYQGYSYVFWFGDAVQPFYHDPSPKFGNQTAYQTDQAYAKQKADYYHDQLKNHKMTADQVLAAVKKDAKLADLGSVLLNPSIKFGYDQSKDWAKEVQYKDIASYIPVQQKTGLGDVQVGTIDDTPAPTPKTKKVPAYCYFVQLNAVKVKPLWIQYQDASKRVVGKFYGV